MTAADARGRGRHDAEVAAGIDALEGYLLWQAQTQEAQARAGSFAERLPWLTTAQSEEVELAYVGDHLDHAERALRATALRCQELRAEYRCAYAALCRRLTAGFALALGVLVALTALLLAARWPADPAPPGVRVPPGAVRVGQAAPQQAHGGMNHHIEHENDRGG